ncbi:DUF362 domain-containing protein [Geobacter sulfurreducens]|jgi:uncharacterized protein (DUF362 family)/Pyruvate/2-oxoacid:ferredoxin oxidoreductase delta subunit|uniref:DUF362 iron-sulfur cluster-binding domain protein n=1 Tax=Geobacter sulfurreducens (strain ATCC 51573 / DSM 12127 / PCA) TaxID=243231 RepID=Q74FV8_GEOSL|nr:DUF362 domain-containing protein [Geobacter sulfurreducens]AAR33826.1 DUF362 iron-sulfur cluster-binding domain protein [Geobacter sulfurreducens PCA]AJY70246.1 (4Fe-4S)-binding protein [Geobacter sulfurreducens]QVW35750.1 DUF362 domain-containing protein [Geobacter sulfurreducens]UAC04572.1 DUF362 domain-containing protein [Geobacter sulfurreducens]UTG93201.1 DUF362 domain-containing protein [Geobacter sulfurreducens]
MHTVAVERAARYDPSEVAEAMDRALASLGGMDTFVRPGERVLIKPNMLAAKAPERAVTTHPEVLRAVIRLVRKAGGIPLVGDSPGIGGFRAVAEKSGMAAVVREAGAELVPFDEAVAVPGSGLFRRMDVARPYLEADRLINLPKLKTHEMMTMTCAVKNLFGAVVGTAKAGWHLKAGADRELFARLLLEIYLLRPPDLTIVDGIVAMEGDGPGSGDPRPMGLILAGANAVAVDVVAAELAGIPKQLLWVERAAERLGIDGWDRSRIATVGLPPDDARVPDFRLPHLSDVQFGIPGFLKNRLRHHLTARPVPNPEGCHLCGACLDACPPRAISVRDGRLHFDYHACIRCFCCRELCPDGSLGVRDGVLLKLLKKFKE